MNTLKPSDPGKIPVTRAARRNKMRAEAFDALVEIMRTSADDRTRGVAAKGILSALAEDKRARMAKAQAKAKRDAAEKKRAALGKKEQIVLEAQRITDNASRFSSPAPPTYVRNTVS